MKNIFNWKKHHSLKKEIVSVVEKMKDVSPDSDEYGKMVKNLETLCSAYNKCGWNINLDPIIAGAFSVLGIILIIKHEQVGIIATKALGFVPKVRV